ncbi:hypothetical protein Nizo2257_1554 [Lactiplantibacillus plantarum]|nr:hypothetical protein LBP_cg0169 [Lactiplantibacillus plantarum subsp. plantarum P-8]KZT97289.1 hypothetical protein Nizo2257_1554 [Lactiplantibacillus plantarum]
MFTYRFNTLTFISNDSHLSNATFFPVINQTNRHVMIIKTMRQPFN